MSKEEKYIHELLFEENEKKISSEAMFINQRVCRIVKIGKDRLSVKYIGKGQTYTDIAVMSCETTYNLKNISKSAFLIIKIQKSIQSNRPASRRDLIYYFEVKIVESGAVSDISIGLADSEFPVNKPPGGTRKGGKSYGYRADGKIFCKKAPVNISMPKYKTGDTVGCGINFLKNEIFFTHNGVSSVRTFRNIEPKDFYPTIALHSSGQHISFNFGASPFLFKIGEMIESEKLEIIKKIIEQKINYYNMHQVVHSYLYSHGYGNTLESFEKNCQMKRDEIFLMKEVDPNKCDDQLVESAGSNMEIERKKSFDLQKKDLSIIAMDGSVMSERKLSEFFMSIEGQSPTPAQRKDSYYSDLFEFGKDGISNMRKNSMNFMETEIGPEKKLKIESCEKERFEIRKCILEGKIAEAISIIKESFRKLYENNNKVLITLRTQEFIETIRNYPLIEGVKYARENLWCHQNDKVMHITLDGTSEETTIETIMGLICYQNPMESPLGYLLSNKQRDLVADVINKEILKFMNFSEKSVLEILLSQLHNVMNSTKNILQIMGVEKFALK